MHDLQNYNPHVKCNWKLC